MNGIENIEKRILDEAEAKANAIIAEAEAKANAVTNQYDEKIKKETTLINEKNVLLLQDIKLKSRQADEMERRKRLSGKRHEIVSEVFQRALDKIMNMDEESYLNLLVKLALDAMEDKMGGELLFNKEDREKYGQKVVDKINSSADSSKSVTLSSDVANITGGVVVRRDKIEFNCDVAVIIRLLSDEMASEVHNRLFPKGA